MSSCAVVASCDYWFCYYYRGRMFRLLLLHGVMIGCVVVAWGDDWLCCCCCMG